MSPIDDEPRESVILNVCQDWSAPVGLGLGMLSTIALLVTGAIATTGLFSAVTTGWLTIGLGGGGALCAIGGLGLAIGIAREGIRTDWLDKISLIVIPLTGVALITVGALGVTGILSGSLVGWAGTGTTTGLVGLILLSWIGSCCYRCATDL